MLNYWRKQYTARGFVPGGMFTNKDICYIPIPKNSSSYVGKLMLANHWGVNNFLTTDLSNKKIIVLLRDPIERWISGMAQYLCSTGYPADDILNEWNSLTTVLVFDRLIFDDHTEKQVYFINSVPEELRVYFNGTHGVAEKLQKYLSTQDIDLNINVDITPSDDTQNKKISTFLKDLISSDDRFVERIKDVYAEDYALIHRVKFYD